jgi:hypothetical protein
MVYDDLLEIYVFIYNSGHEFFPKAKKGGPEPFLTSLSVVSFEQTNMTLFIISRCNSGLVLGLNPCTTIWTFFVSPEALQNANMAILA